MAVNAVRATWPTEWETVDAELRGNAKRRSGLDAHEMYWLREAERVEIWRPLGMVSMLDYMDRVLGQTPETARKRLRVARALADLPLVSAALERGELTFSAVRELTRVATSATEREWVEAIRGRSSREIEDLVTGHRLGDLPDDPRDPEAVMHVVRFELDAAAFATLREARLVLDAEHGSRLDDSALVEALCAAVRDGGSREAHDGRATFQIAYTICECCDRGWQTGGGDAATIDTAVTLDSTSPDASVDARPATKEGQVFLGEARTTTDQSTPVAIAMFVDGPLYVTLGSMDGCDAIDDMPASSLAVGSITVTGTTSEVTLAQSSLTSPYTANPPAPADMFAAGATLTVTATGAVVPAFTGNVVAPQPLADVVFPASISRAAPATITWTAGTADTMWIVVASAEATPGGIMCKAPDIGSFTLTTGAIGLLPATLTQLTMFAYRMNETPVTAGAWTVSVRAADGVLADTTPIGP